MSKTTKVLFKVLDVIMIFMLTFGSPMSAFAQVWTDPTDYPPGSTVWIEGDNSDGAAYIKDETVHVVVNGPNDENGNPYSSECYATVIEPDQFNRPGYLYWNCPVTLWDSPYAVGNYTYTASGSQVTEQGSFTDANQDPVILDSVVIGGFNIDGNVPDVGPIEYLDPYGAMSELGPLNENTTKLEVINTDHLPTLGYTSITPGNDLTTAWLQTNVDPNTGHVWLYFAFARASASTGLVAFEFEKNAAPVACDYTDVNFTNPPGATNTATQNLIANCNPFANRSVGDFLLVFDLQGQNLQIVKRTFLGNGLGFDTTTLDQNVSAAAYSGVGTKDVGLMGEGAVDLTATVFGSTPDACFSVANIIPMTITGNSDTADFKDVVLGDFSGTGISSCGTVKVTKVTDPAGGAGSFLYTLSRTDNSAIKYSGDTSATGTLTSDGDFDTIPDLKKGTNYTLAEGSVGPTWALQSISCTTDETTYDVVPGGTAFAVQPSTITYCTITNKKQTGTLTVIKHVINDNGGTATADGFTIDLNVEGQDPFPGAEAPGTTFTLIDGTAYDVTEDMGSWAGKYSMSLSGDCSGTIEAGVDKTCTITNDDQAGTIIVEKQTDPDGLTGDFTFTGDAAGTISDGGQIVVSGLSAGMYTSTELASEGWQLTGISCDDANSIGNVASATATFHVENGETVKCVFTNDPLPTVTLTKEADPTTLPEPGGAFTFTLTITNTSVETVTITALTDSNALSQECLDLIGTTLAAGASTSCMYQVTHTDAGTYPNTAHVTVADNEQNTASAEASASVSVTDVKPTVTLTKEADPTTLPEPGGAFTFTLTITNTSVETVTITALTDDNPLPAACTDLIDDVLTPGQTVSCSYTVTHTDAGTYPNTASVTVEDNEGNPASDSDSETVTITDVLPMITVTKTANPTSVPETGANVTFTYTVTNNSVEPVEITGLFDDVFGPQAGDSDCQVGTVLGVGGSCTFLESHFISGDFESGISHNNVFNAEAKDNEDNKATDDDDAEVTFTDVTADIAIVKVTVDGATFGDGLNILTGEAIIWRYTVTNLGNYPLSNVTVTDSTAGVTPTPVSGDTNTNGKLDTTEIWIYEASGTAITGDYSNTSTAYGDFTDGAGNVESDTATDGSSYFGADPQIAVTKVTVDGATSGDGLNILTGEAISWKYTVTNTGNVALNNVSVTDSKGVTVTCPKTTLAVGESIVCTASGTSTTGNYSNTGTATGSYTDSANHPRTDTATDNSSYFGADPQISIVKKTVGSNGAEGDGVWVVINETVTWNYYVTNTGNVALSNVAVTDDQGVSVSCPKTTLAVGESMTCTASAINTVPILTTYKNIGTAYGDFTDDAGHKRSDTATDPSSYLSRPFGLLMTNTELCSLPNNQFNLLFTPDQGKGYKLNASNPGQFYYNMFYVGPGDTTVKLILPYPWVVQGNMPIHVYNNVTFTTKSTGQTCLTPGMALTNPPQTYVTLDSYNPQNFGSYKEVEVPIPPTGSENGFLYINIHLDYGLKDTTYWTKGINDNAVSVPVAPYPTYPTIVNPTSYTFKDGEGTQIAITSNNVFKKNPGIGGLVYNTSGAPIANVTVTISVSTGKNPITTTVKTDSDGWYMWSYKWTGKPAEFTVSIPASLGLTPLSQKIWLKANGYVEVDWNKP